MADKAVLTEEQSKKILKLLYSPSQDDKDLALSIVDNCDIEKSFVELLWIMNKHEDRQYTMNTPIIKSKNVQDYIIGKLLSNNVKLIPIEQDLNFILDLWERHNKLQVIKADLKVKKRLISAYVRRLDEIPFAIKKIRKHGKNPKTKGNSFKF